MTIVIVTHELASIFAVGDNSVFLDAETRTMIATGHPRWLLEHADQPKVRAFLTRGAAGAARHEPRAAQPPGDRPVRPGRRSCSPCSA